jgi:hypothetical protein
MNWELIVVLMVICGIALTILPATLTASAASRKGRDGALWFIVTLLWTLVVTGACLVEGFIWLGAGLMASFSGVGNFAPILLLAAVDFILAFLPYIVVCSMSGKSMAGQDRARAARARILVRRRVNGGLRKLATHSSRVRLGNTTLACWHADAKK